MLNELVEECITRYGGGRPYFDQLDENVRTPLFFEALATTVDERYGYLPPLVVTGQFGQAFRQWLLKESGRDWHTILVYEGGLRYRSVAQPATYGSLIRSGYVFLDDSMYRGRTLAEVSTSLYRGGSRVLSSHVIYDGSTDRRADVALYRYYDRHALPGIANPTHTGKGQ